MPKLKRITVKTETDSYPVIIGANSFSSLKKEIEKLKLFKNIFVIIDENVKKYFSQRILANIKAISTKNDFYTLKKGELAKSHSELNKIYSALIEKKYGRDTLILAIGGGVTGDLAGYAASTYMRGIQLLHVPTTLLADVDSSLGGKTGINFNNRKNMVGTFYQPDAVLIDTDFIRTLPEGEFISGLGEVVKYAFITTKNFYDFTFDNFGKILSRNFEVMNKIIYESVLFKSSVVARDEKESGLRKILNFGHTFAHAYESDLNFKIKHGEAVIAGIISALYLSYIKGYLTEKKLGGFLTNLGLIKLKPGLKKLNTENVLDFMRNDKKNRENKIKFILLKNIGEIVSDVETDKREVIQSILLTKEFLNN